MKVLLINPPRSYNKGNAWKVIDSCTPPFGLLSIAAILRKNKIDVSILDGNADRKLDSLRWLSKEFDIIGITASTPLINTALEIAKLCRKYSRAKIVLGGIHPTVMYAEVFSHPAVDVVVSGEGEQAMLDIVSGFTKGILHPEGYTDLDTIPRLPYDLLPMDKYYPALGSYKRLPSIGMIVSRGCPGKCTFCLGGKVFGDKIRYYSPQHIFDEIEFLSKTYGIKDICFYDDTFTTSKKIVNELCELLIKLDITWSCFSRIDTINYDLLKVMKRAGCHQIMYGIESADKEIIKNINKKIDLDYVGDIVRLTRGEGINSRLTFMFGNQGETVESIKKTIKFAIRLNPEFVIFNIATPYPGTDFYKWADERDYLMTYNWDDYDLSKPIVRLPTIEPEEIKKYYKIAYRRFYMRPSYMIKNISQILSLCKWIGRKFG